MQKKKYWKNGHVSKWKKTRKGKNNNKNSPCFLAKFLSSKREIYSLRSKSRIRISHHINTYPPYSIHMHILIGLYDFTLFGSIVWLYNILTAGMLFLVIATPMSFTISLSCRKRRHNIIDLVRIHKYHIYWEIWECQTIKALSFISENLQNSGIIVEQRAWDIVLDLSLLWVKCMILVLALIHHIYRKLSIL
jgi:hypothetical protein